MSTCISEQRQALQAACWKIRYLTLSCLTFMLVFPYGADGYTNVGSIFSPLIDHCPVLPTLNIKSDRLNRNDDYKFHIPDITGIMGRPAPVPILLPPFQPTDYLLLSFRGLPKNFTLSSGFRTADAWLVSAHESGGLQMQPPADYTGRFTMEVRLIRGQDVIARTNIVQISFNQPAKAEAAIEILEPAESKAETVQVEPKADTVLVQLEPMREIRLLDLAQTMLDQNDIAAARAIYRRLAYYKSPQATFRLALSYDPAFLSQFRISDGLDNIAEARRWYQAAAKLGVSEASQKLVTLEDTQK